MRFVIFGAVIFVYIVLNIAVIPVESGDGRIFVFTFMNLSTADRGRKGFQQMSISSVEDARVRAVIPAGPDNPPREVFLRLDDTNSRTFQLLISEDMAIPKDTQIATIGLMVSSDVPISVQAIKAQAGSGDGFNVLPVTQESKQFFIPSWPGVPNGHSLFSIVSLKDGTCVEIFKVTNAGEYERLHFFGLDSLQVFQGLSDSDDYSGYFVNLTREGAVIAGNECAQIPHQKSYCDHLVTQVVPVSSWGKELVAGAIDGRSVRSAGYFIRIFASKKDTEVTATVAAGSPKTFNTASGTWTGTGLNLDSTQFIGTLDPGRFIELRTDDSMAATHISCSEPCMATQYNPSFLAVPGETTETDPYMTNVPWFDQFRSTFSFGTAKYYSDNSTLPKRAEDMINYITVVAGDAYRAGLTMDNQPIGITNWEQLSAKPGYYMGTRAVPPGFHTVKHTDANAQVMVYVYGHGTNRVNTGYGFLGGGYSKGTEPEGNFYNISALEEASTGGSSGGGGASGGSGGSGTNDATTAEPQTGDYWLQQVTDEELSSTVYALSLRAEFKTQERKGKIIEKKCSEPLLQQLQYTRLPAMTDLLNRKVIKEKCNGLNITAKLTNGNLYSEYSRGSIAAQVELSGSRQVTFRNLQDCGNNLRNYVKPLENWPKVNGRNFLYAEVGDCDPINVTDYQWEVYRADFKCDSFDGSSVFGGARAVSHCLPLVMMSIILLAFLAALRNYKIY